MDKRIQLILLVVLLLVGSNLLTYYKVDGITRKEKKAMQKSLDSLQVLFEKGEKIHAKELAVRKESQKRDSILVVELRKKLNREGNIIAKQNRTLASYKNLTNDQIIFKLDSAYRASI